MVSSLLVVFDDMLDSASSSIEKGSNISGRYTLIMLAAYEGTELRGSVLLARSLRHHSLIKRHTMHTIVYWRDCHTTKLMSHDCTLHDHLLNTQMYACKPQ